MSDVQEAVNLRFVPTNDEMTQYSITLDVPVSYRKHEEVPSFLCDVAAIHLYLSNDENMMKIMQYFEEHVGDYNVEIVEGED